MTTNTNTPTQSYFVSYRYNGGSSMDLVQASSAEEATRLGMEQAAPRWASDPSTPCEHVSTKRALSWQEVAGLPLGGIQTVRRPSYKEDRGGPWLVVCRDRIVLSECRGDMWLTEARWEVQAPTFAAAERWLKKQPEHLRDRYSVIPRSEVEIIEVQ